MATFRAARLVEKPGLLGNQRPQSLNVDGWNDLHASNTIPEVGQRRVCDTQSVNTLPCLMRWKFRMPTYKADSFSRQQRSWLVILHQAFPKYPGWYLSKLIRWWCLAFNTATRHDANIISSDFVFVQTTRAENLQHKDPAGHPSYRSRPGAFGACRYVRGLRAQRCNHLLLQSQHRSAPRPACGGRASCGSS